MSIAIMSRVWKEAPVAGSDLLVLLALADSAGDDDLECYPSIAHLAQKSRLSEKQVKRILKHLQEQEIIEIKVQGASGRGRVKAGHVPNLYKICPENWKALETILSDGGTPDRGDARDPRTRPAHDPPTGDARDPQNHHKESSIEPSITRTREKSPTSDISKWGVDQLNSYFEEHTALLTSILRLTGIDPSFVNWSEMVQSQRRSYCRACETYLASSVAYDAYEVWLKKRYSWRKTVFVTLKEFVEDIPRYKTDLAHKGVQDNAPHDYAAPYHQPYVFEEKSDAIPMPDEARAAMEALRKAWDVTDRKQP